MQKLDKWMRQLPLKIVIPMAERFRKVLLFHPDCIWANKKRRYCICREFTTEHMVGCSRCNEWYHTKCMGLKGLARKEVEGDDDWECGFCSDAAPEDGIHKWCFDVSAPLKKSKKAVLERHIDNTPLAMNVTLDAPTEEPQRVPPWDDLVELTRQGGKKIRAEEKVRKGKAERVVRAGGHHSVDERGNKGVQPRRVDGALIDELEEAGLLQGGDEDVNGVSDISDDE